MTEIETRDRATIARLAEAGLRPHAPLCLTFRLVTVDGLSPAEVSQVLGIELATVLSRVSKVRQALLRAQDAHARGAATPCSWEGETDPDPDDDDPLIEAARHLLEAIRNRGGAAGGERALQCGPLVSLADARQIIARAAARRGEWECRP